MTCFFDFIRYSSFLYLIIVTSEILFFVGYWGQFWTENKVFISFNISATKSKCNACFSSAETVNYLDKLEMFAFL